VARHWFGQSLTDWTFTVGSSDEAVLAGGVEISFYNAAVGGSQYTDLLDQAGSPITTVTSSDGTSLPVGTIPRFQGPDTVTEMWADAGGGARFLMVAVDLGATITTLEGTVAGLAADLSDLPYAPVYLYRDAGTGAWPTRPDTSKRVWWIETQPSSPSPPTIGGSYMIDDLDFYVGQAGA
jgi:hypothetical protein